MKKNRINEITALDTKSELIKVARYMRLLVNGAGISLPIVFAWLKLKGIDFSPFINDINSSFLFKVAMAFCYLCWVAGLISDTSDQELVFVFAPSWRHVAIGGTTAGVFITTMFGVLCYVDTARMFAVFLAVFLLLNVATWIYLTKIVMLPAFENSSHFYIKSKKFDKLEQLRLVFSWYLCGKWQIARFFVATLIISALNWLSFSYRSGETTMHFGSYMIEIELITSVVIFLYVLIMESWIWLMRLRVKIGIGILDSVAKEYRLTPIHG
ncbi:MAG: hypothetical protein RLZZ352_2056 [Pseudomonadota bacterium]|jgi:hypothetical protein